MSALAANADLGLDEAVGTTFSTPVKEQDDRPGASAIVASGHVDLIAVGLTGDGDGAIQKPGRRVLRRRRRRPARTQNQREQGGCKA
jgi:hypothetical protein